MRTARKRSPSPSSAKDSGRSGLAARPTCSGKRSSSMARPHTIVGVIPAAAEWPGNVRLWTPFAGDPAQTFQSYGFEAIGRLKKGVSVADAEKDLLRTQQPIWDARDKQHVVSPFARPLHEQFSRNYRDQASTLGYAAAILLIVACANVASVMLARALARRREMGIRLAVGASRTRLARQLFLENLVVAAVGGSIGLGLGSSALKLLLRAAGDQVPPWARFGLDWRVIAFSALVTIATTLLFGWAPALHAHPRQPPRRDARRKRHRRRQALVDAERSRSSSPQSSHSPRCSRLRRPAAARLRSGRARRSRLPSRSRAHVHGRAARGDLPRRCARAWRSGIGSPRGSRRCQESTSVGLVSCPPLGCHWGTFFDIEGRAPLAPGQSNPVTLYRPTSPGYFKAMGIRLKYRAVLRGCRWSEATRDHRQRNVREDLLARRQ